MQADWMSATSSRFVCDVEGVVCQNANPSKFCFPWAKMTSALWYFKVTENLILKFQRPN